MSLENVVNYIHVKNVDSEAQKLMRFIHTLKISMDHLNRQKMILHWKIQIMIQTQIMLLKEMDFETPLCD